MQRAGLHEGFPVSVTRRALLRRSGAAVLACFAAGCGTELYNARIDRTKSLFEYHNKLDQALQGKWDRADYGLSMRIPRGFSMIPGPPPPKKLEDGTFEEPAADTRHPAFLGVELPGLVEAWQMPGVGSLYVCSNHDRFLQIAEAGLNAAKPEDFFTDLEAVLQQGLKFTMSPDDAKSPTDVNAHFREKIPTTNDFADSKDFKSITIEAGEDPNYAPLAANVYEIEAGLNQVAIICIYLKSTAQSPDRALRTALETLEVSGVTPRPANSVRNTGPGGSNF